MGARGGLQVTAQGAEDGAPRFLLVEDPGSPIGARLEQLGWIPEIRTETIGAINLAAISHVDVLVVVCTERSLLTPAFQSDAVRIARGAPRVAVISEAGPEAAAYAARLGWHGFVSTDSTDAVLLGTIAAAALGELSFPASTTSSLVRALARVAPVTSIDASVLTPRQRQIVTLISQGATDVEISSVLGISRSTAHKHVQNARRRMRAKTRSQLVAAVRPESLGWQPT
ncbi:MAG TPA: LuxR C-terminal-related transcriptional regulator [Methylomirabilota bacterium]|nr:LuxR C-terminal-related transcriptional regulator [Methylomirabilota bacterium]